MKNINDSWWNNKKCFIIAEISGNHNQDYETAKQLVEVACDAGVDAIKLQTYTPDTMTINCDNEYFKIKSNKLWEGKTLYELYKIAYTPWEWFPSLSKIANERGVILFSTPFDITAVDFLEKYGVPFYKVASFEIGDLELLKKIACTKKPVIISRGMASFEEIELAYHTLKENGSPHVAVLHCVSAYPAKPEEMNLLTIKDLKTKFEVVGLSDHTLTTETAIASIALGAKIIEKHITLDRSKGGVDSAFSLEPSEFKKMIEQIRIVESALGTPSYILSNGENKNKIFKRSLFVVKDMKKGEKFNNENLRCIRPGYGIKPKYLPNILGKEALVDIKRGTPLSDSLIEGGLEFI